MRSVFLLSTLLAITPTSPAIAETPASVRVRVALALAQASCCARSHDVQPVQRVAVGQEASAKTCFCSPLCVCGCNQGAVCSCSTRIVGPVGGFTPARSAAAPMPMSYYYPTPAPTFLPSFGGSFGGACAGGG